MIEFETTLLGKILINPLMISAILHADKHCQYLYIYCNGTCFELINNATNKENLETVKRILERA